MKRIFAFVICFSCCYFALCQSTSDASRTSAEASQQEKEQQEAFQCLMHGTELLITSNNLVIYRQYLS